ncbi:quinolinate synthase NadA [Chromobacterium haemolyticum]|uniref:Quinolinate synthase n=1 Tax=Chromobacterium haemolyticum TaxID=394935 RepID=A0A1W0DBD2_9NEIS|nr:quinolinate synthase NadA [Chromobacterium haemolyticum]MBK0416079.1 quinolinate synthase NadA [Chromobacterium haemolyticum]MBO0416950.1 quinolinate synthase NadA [Chromobacterium haemolyticum]MBO0500466.1 quinolinate synthase NadA [Chromobacterium haemolyticum]OQS37811.1 quinolinate synthetase [Chromobacterium haemolyticum]OQS44329.1 quinolinate synthetase [Chromobacterium haemolyticum]
MTKRVVTLAHYYTQPEIQQMADKVGDSLELSLYAKEANADIIVFAGVRFMAETAKILNPQAEVILPDAGSTCSLVTQTDVAALAKWRKQHPDHVHVSYINSSAEHKALSDWIVTSRNVDDIIAHLYAEGKKVIFSPDRNMGGYLNYQYGYNMPLWSAVCEVHDKFNEAALDEAFAVAGSEKYLIAHPESPLPVLKKADYVGSTSGMLNWVKQFSGSSDAVIFVATEDGILYNMGLARPDLDLRQAPIYAGCQCNSCPYMKMNTIEAVKRAQQGVGLRIDYLSREQMDAARLPIERMLEFSQRYYA